MKLLKALTLIALLALIILAFIGGIKDVFGEEIMREIVIHHSDTFVDTVETIDAYHKSKGWDGCGYHFVIYRNGEVHKGRDINKQGAHAIGRNHMTGICLIGKDNYSDNQLRSLITLLNDLGYPIENHHEECP